MQPLVLFPGRFLDVSGPCSAISVPSVVGTYRARFSGQPFFKELLVVRMPGRDNWEALDSDHWLLSISPPGDALGCCGTWPARKAGARY